MNCIDRRRFLLSFAGLFGIGALSPELWGAGDDENELSVDFSAPGYLIPENFLGLSFDTIDLLLDRILLPENRSFISLVRRLGTKGVIRIGGNSSDRPSLRMGLTIRRTHIEHLAAFLSATGWQLIYGLDLGSGKAEQAAAEAEMIAQIVGPKLLAFQFGNEPDGFRVDIRKSNYNPLDYIAEWREFLKALRTRVPGAPLAGPDISFDTSWLAPFIHAFGSEVVCLTCHYYSEGPASSPGVTMEKMLGSGEALAKIIDSVAGYTAGSGLKVRMAESNSVYEGGKPGISDTLGQRSGESMSCSPWPTLAGSALTFTAAVTIILPLPKPRAARLSRRRFTMQCSCLLMLVGARSYRSTRVVSDHGCEPSPCEALVANIESFLLTRILLKMNMSTLSRRGREQPSCG